VCDLHENWHTKYSQSESRKPKKKEKKKKQTKGPGQEGGKKVKVKWISNVDESPVWEILLADRFLPPLPPLQAICTSTLFIHFIYIQVCIY
jgi:hypothetical protein